MNIFALFRVLSSSKICKISFHFHLYITIEMVPIGYIHILLIVNIMYLFYLNIQIRYLSSFLELKEADLAKFRNSILLPTCRPSQPTDGTPTLPILLLTRRPYNQLY